jgi:hypothetical protein
LIPSHYRYLSQEERDEEAGKYIDFVGQMASEYGIYLGSNRLGALTGSQQRIYAEALRRKNARQEHEQEQAESQNAASGGGDGPLAKAGLKRPKGTLRPEDKERLAEIEAQTGS